MKEKVTLKDLLNHLDSGEALLHGNTYDSLMRDVNKKTRKLTLKINTKTSNDTKIRKLMEKIIGQKLDDEFSLFTPIYIDFGKNLKIGKHVFINAGCCFQDQGGIYIGNNVNIGHECVFATLNHGLTKDTKYNLYPKKIVIKDYAWIGSKTVVLPGVTIGENAVIGAGSVVTKDIPDNAIAVGNPARVIKFIEEK